MASRIARLLERALERLCRAFELAADAFGQRGCGHARGRGVRTVPSAAPGARPKEIVTAGS